MSQDLADMYATLRKIQCAPGKAGEVADRIRAEYLPMLDEIGGALGYTLVHLGDDVVSSMGLFDTEEHAAEANERARAWTAERLAPLVASPLDAAAGEVLISERLDG